MRPPLTPSSRSRASSGGGGGGGGALLLSPLYTSPQSTYRSRSGSAPSTRNNLANVIVHGDGRVELPSATRHAARGLRDVLASAGSLLEYIVTLQARAADVEAAPLEIERRPSLPRAGRRATEAAAAESPQQPPHVAAAIGLVREGPPGGRPPSLAALAKQARLDLTREPGVVLEFEYDALDVDVHTDAGDDDDDDDDDDDITFDCS